MKKGQKVIFNVPSLAGVKGEVLMGLPGDDPRLVCVVTDDHHPSGHSHKGALVCVDQKDLAPAPAESTLPEIQKLG